MTTTTAPKTYQAVVIMSTSNWNNLTIEIDTDPFDDCPEFLSLTTTAHDFTNVQFDDVPFDDGRYAADIDAELAAAGWMRTSDFVNHGDFRDEFTVVRVDVPADATVLPMGDMTTCPVCSEWALYTRPNGAVGCAVCGETTVST